MIPFKLIGYGVVAAAILTAGLYIRHTYKEAQRVPALVETINILEKQKRQEREQVQKALEQEADLRSRLSDSAARSAALADRLRRAYASVPETSPGPAEPAGTPGAGEGGAASELDLAVAGVIAACKSDSIRFSGWQRYWEQLPESLK